MRPEVQSQELKLSFVDRTVGKKETQSQGSYQREVLIFPQAMYSCIYI